MKYITAFYTDAGEIRKDNQDSYLCIQASAEKENYLFAAVCDGCGGLKHGEIASGSVVNRLNDWFSLEFPKLIGIRHSQELMEGVVGKDLQSRLYNNAQSKPETGSGSRLGSMMQNSRQGEPGSRLGSMMQNSRQGEPGSRLGKGLEKSQKIDLKKSVGFGMENTLETDLKNSLGLLMEDTHGKLARYGADHGIRLGTTCTVLLLFRGRYYIMNVGDSRVYLISDRLYQLTKDHTLAQQEVERGIMTYEEAAKDPKSHVLTRCIGAGDDPTPDFFTGPVQSGQTFLLCSDGFTHRITPAEIRGQLGCPECMHGNELHSSLTELTSLCKSRGERDNITAIAIRTNDHT